jgi:uncharacterized membrane protein YgcG
VKRSDPALSGRVVDQSGVMTAEAKSDVEAKVLEDKSGIQLVVATVKIIGGQRHRNLRQSAFSLLEARRSAKE